MLDLYCYQKSRLTQWPNLMFLPKVEKFGYKWREGKIIAMGRGMN